MENIYKLLREASALILASEWKDEGPFPGKKDYRIWRSRKTGEVRFQITEPGTESTLEKGDEKESVENTFNLTWATSSIPGLDRLIAQANAGDESAKLQLQEINRDALKYFLSEIEGVKLDISGTNGVYCGYSEPASQVKVTASKGKEKEVLAACEKFASNFNQWEIHRFEYLGDDDIDNFGTQYEDGSYNSCIARYKLDKPLSVEEIDKLSKTVGLDGFTQNGEWIETYYGKDKDNVEEARKYFKGVGETERILGGRIRGMEKKSIRLWRYGKTGGNSVVPYERIRGPLRPKSQKSNPIARRIAERLKGKKVTGFKQADRMTPEQESIHKSIAKNFLERPMNELHNPVVKRAYDELASEVKDQYSSIPIKVEMFDGKGEPYKNSSEMRRDVLENNHLYIYGTSPESFGPPDSYGEYKNHPLLQDSGFKDVNGKPMLYNDLFRAVHDYYAHTMTAVQFGPLGEEAAWKNHMQMTRSPWARLALTMETRGQNSVVNFGPNAEHNRKNPKNTIFADQKISLLDPDYSKIGDEEHDRDIEEIADYVRKALVATRQAKLLFRRFRC